MRTLAFVWLLMIGGMCVLAALTDPHRKGAVALVVVGGLTVASAIQLWEPGL